MFGVDFDHRAHAGAQGGTALGVGEDEAERQALDHLDPVAGRVLRRQDGEFGARGGADRLHRGLPDHVGIGVDLDRDRLAEFDVGELGFLQVRLDPDVLVGDDREQRRLGLDELTRLELDLADPARRGRVDLGALHVEQAAVVGGLGLQELGVILGLQVGLALEAGEDLAYLALQDGDLLLRRGGVAARLVVALAADIAAFQQAGAALEGVVEIGPVVARELELGDLDPVGGAARFDLRAGAVALGRGVIQRDAVGLVVEAEQQLAGLHRVVLAHLHGQHLARHLRGDRHLVGLDVGVLAGHVALAGDVVIGADQGRRAGHEHHQHHAHHEAGEAALAAHRRRARRVRALRGLGRGGKRFGLSGVGCLGIVSHRLLPPAPTHSPCRWPIAGR